MILDGKRYEGSFETIENNPPSFKGPGTIFSPNGDIHIGTFKDGKINGYGRIYHKNGCIYGGLFFDNILNGVGKITLRDKIATIKGYFQLGHLVGKGLYI